MGDKKITEFRIVDHGVTSASYFQGHGIAFTSYTDCATGCGGNPYSALEDALDQIVEQGWNVEPILFCPDYEKMCDSEESVDHSDCPEYDDDCDRHWYVSVDVR